jgi:hypothetical protein
VNSPPLDPDPLLSVLVEHEVDFIVAGGYEVAAHGHVRATEDIDVCPDAEARCHAAPSPDHSGQELTRSL